MILFIEIYVIGKNNLRTEAIVYKNPGPFPAAQVPAGWGK
jgi:hypothetical protein